MLLLSAIQTPTCIRDHAVYFIHHCSKAWDFAFDYILWVSYWVSCLVSAPLSFTLLSQYLVCEFGAKFLSFILTAGTLQPLVSYTSHGPTACSGTFKSCSIKFLIHSLSIPLYFVLLTAFFYNAYLNFPHLVEIILSDGPVPQCLFRSSG